MSTEGDLYLMPETRCMRWGHVFVPHELFGLACARCGKSADNDEAREEV